MYFFVFVKTFSWAIFQCEGKLLKMFFTCEFKSTGAPMTPGSCKVSMKGKYGTPAGFISSFLIASGWLDILPQSVTMVGIRWFVGKTVLLAYI
jgi:hypothetical protein